MSIGTRLKQARKAAKLTQQELAAKVGLKQSTLSDLEVGKSISSTSLAALAHALGVTALWLETGKGPMAVGAALFPKDEKPLMTLAFEDERVLLDLFRRANERGRQDIMRMARQAGGADSAAANEA